MMQQLQRRIQETATKQQLQHANQATVAPEPSVVVANADMPDAAFAAALNKRIQGLSPDENLFTGQLTGAAHVSQVAADPWSS